MKKLLPLLLFAACSTTTQVTDVYRDPSAGGKVNFNKVAAIALTDDAAVRRDAEDEMVKFIGPKAVASYTIFTPDDEQNAQTASAKLRTLGIDGAVTMRLLSAGEEPIDVKGYVPDSYKAFTGYYGGGTKTNAGWEQVVRVETQIFSIPQNKMLWSAATKTFEAKDARSVVDAVARSVADELKKEGLR